MFPFSYSQHQILTTRQTTFHGQYKSFILLYCHLQEREISNLHKHGGHFIHTYYIITQETQVR